MIGMDAGRARAVADLAEGCLLATVEIADTPERVFQALTTNEIVRWWVRPGVFDTSDWAGDVRPGGLWRSSGHGGGRPYELEGRFLAVDPPIALVHTWHLLGTPGAPTTVTYRLEPSNAGTRLTLRHDGFTSRDSCLATCTGWETSFEALADLLGHEAAVRGYSAYSGVSPSKESAPKGTV